MKMKKLKGIAVVSIVALLLSACSGSGKESNTRKDDVNLNIEDKVDDMISVDKAEKSEYVRFNVTDVISVNKLKGYAEDENGNQIGPEKTINMIGLGDKGNLYYAGKILSTKWIGEVKEEYESCMNENAWYSWIDEEDSEDFIGCQAVDSYTMDNIKNNHDLWFERADMSKNLTDSTELDGYLWLTMPNEGLDEEHLYNTYNYQMIKSQFAQYDNSKICDKYKEVFDEIYYGKQMQLIELKVTGVDDWDATCIDVEYYYEQELKNQKYFIRLDPITTDANGWGYMELYDKVKSFDAIKEKYIKENSIIYVSTSYDDEKGALNRGYAYTKHDIYNNYEDFINYNYLGIYVREIKPDISVFNMNRSSFEYILRYYNGY